MSYCTAFNQVYHAVNGNLGINLYVFLNTQFLGYLLTQTAHTYLNGIAVINVRHDMAGYCPYQPRWGRNGKIGKARGHLQQCSQIV